MAGLKAEYLLRGAPEAFQAPEMAEQSPDLDPSAPGTVTLGPHDCDLRGPGRVVRRWFPRPPGDDGPTHHTHKQSLGGTPPEKLGFKWNLR